MKSLTMKLLATIGVLAILYIAIASAFRSVADYEMILRHEFDTPDAIEAIGALYAKVEADPRDPSLKTPDISPRNSHKVRLIPNSWVPERLSHWRRDQDVAAPAHLGVCAFYDESDALIGIGLLRSRYGCFASKDPMRCPSTYPSLRRITDGPIFVTIGFWSDI